MALAVALRRESLLVTPATVGRVCDLVVNRLWLSRVELRPDPAARATATELLALDPSLGPYRRALLHFGLGAEHLARTPLVDLAYLDEASEHLNRALGLARTLALPAFIARCQAMLALIEVPRGNLTSAEDLCRAALGLADDRASGTVTTPPGFWRLRALLVLQWARHYQGKQIETDVLRTCSERSIIWSDPILATLLSTVTALAALEAGDLAAARRALAIAAVDRRIAGVGIWRLPMLTVDGYLCVIHDDDQGTDRVVAELESLPAPAEAAVLRAARLSHAGSLTEALQMVSPVASGEVSSVSLRYPVAAIVEAVLLEGLGRTEEADQSMSRALGATQSINALRLFTRQGPAHLATLAGRAAAASPRNQWAATVAAYLDGFVTSPADRAYEQPVRTDLGPAPAGGVRVPGPTDAESPLTPRELEVLRLVNEGASHAQIAAELYVSLNTTKTHLRSIRRKLGVDRTGEAAALARRAGWL